jgi:aspartyl-tRNA(Asn)/glutamyl-tRNA(Gln) amidotransferase subunit A
MPDPTGVATILPPTHGFFEEALALVRSAPLYPRERPPAITLPTIPARSMEMGTGDVDGMVDDAWSLAARIAAGRVSVVEVVGQARAAIERHDRAFCAFEFVADVDEIASRLDAELSRGACRGPLHGVPVTVKDVVDVAGMPTTASSKGYHRRVATADGKAVAHLRAAGAVIMGKVTTHELALGVTTPQSRNPWDPGRIPGGSSGGSAISMLTGMAWASLGTDTRASIRVPAALCGLVGTKPSLDLVPRDRWVTLSWTMDHLAPMTRSVRDAALLLDVLSDRGSYFRRVLPRGLEGLRFGWSPTTLEGADRGVADLMAQALASIGEAGGVVLEQAIPSANDLALANAVGMVLSRVQAAQYHAEIGTDVDALTPEVRDQLRAATSVEATAYVRALRLRALLRERLEFAACGVDLLVMPTCKTVAPRREDAAQHLLALSENCVPWSLVDFPAMSLPMGVAAGLPVGLQVVAPPGQDAGLLTAAHAIERILPPPPPWS